MTENLINMNYLLNEEQIAFRAEVREFVEKKIKPNSFDWDVNNVFPLEVIKEMGEKGWLGLPWPKEYGGMGKTFLEYSILVEEISRVDAGVGVFMSVHSSAATSPIMDWGSEEQKKYWVPQLASGDKLGAFVLTESEAGSDAGGLQTTAVLDGDEFVINGEKIYITNAPYADIYIVFALTTPGIGTRGITAFIVEKGTPGFEIPDTYGKMGLHSSSTGRLTFNNVRIPKENQLGPEGKGFNIAMTTLNGGRIGIGSQALGIAQGAFEEGLDHTKNRYQFGKPLAAIQDIQFKFADMGTKINAARHLVYTAAKMKDEGKGFLEAAAMAKLFASETAAFVTDTVLQMHGGAGFITGIPIERMYRDTRINRIYEGASEVQKIVISRSIIGKLDGASEKKESKEAANEKPKRKITGERKNIIINEGSAEDRVNKLIDAIGIENLKCEPCDINGSISDADRVVAFGMGLEKEEDMELINQLANATGSVVSASRPIAETRKWLPVDRYIGLSGQKFPGKNYIGVGISGAVQHLLGLKETSNIIVINNNENAPFFAEADYGIVGDYKEILPILIEKLQ